MTYGTKHNCGTQMDIWHLNELSIWSPFIIYNEVIIDPMQSTVYYCLWLSRLSRARWWSWWKCYIQYINSDKWHCSDCCQLLWYKLYYQSFISWHMSISVCFPPFLPSTITDCTHLYAYVMMIYTSAHVNLR